MCGCWPHSWNLKKSSTGYIYSFIKCISIEQLFWVKHGTLDFIKIGKVWSSGNTSNNSMMKIINIPIISTWNFLATNKNFTYLSYSELDTQFQHKFFTKINITYCVTSSKSLLTYLFIQYIWIHISIEIF